jgi:hypothetical protein
MFWGSARRPIIRTCFFCGIPANAIDAVSLYVYKATTNVLISVVEKGTPKYPSQYVYWLQSICRTCYLNLRIYKSTTSSVSLLSRFFGHLVILCQLLRLHNVKREML